MKTDSEFIEGLRIESLSASRGGGKMTEFEQLTVEAYDCARRGDIADARLRIERRDNAKWWDKSACKRAYDAAMADQLGVTA